MVVPAVPRCAAGPAAMAVDGLADEGGRPLAGQPGVDQPEPLLLPRKRQPLQLRRLDPGGTVHVEADEAGKGAQLRQHTGVVQPDPQAVRQALHLADADAAAPQGHEGLLADAVEQFAHQPQGLRDRAQGGVAAQRRRGGPSRGTGGVRANFSITKPPRKRHADAVRKLHVGGVQRHQQAPGQEPVHRPDVGGLVQHGGAPLRLGNGAHGPVAEPCEQRRRAFRGAGEDLLEGLRRGGPVLQRQGGLHRRRRGGDRRPAAVQFRDELHHALREGRLEPDEFGVAAAQPGRVDSDHVLEAADRKVDRCLVPAAGGGAVRGLRPVDEGQFLQRMQHPLDRRGRGAVDELLQHRGGGAVSGIRVGAQVQGFQHLHLRAG